MSPAKELSTKASIPGKQPAEGRALYRVAIGFQTKASRIESLDKLLISGTKTGREEDHLITFSLGHSQPESRDEAWFVALRQMLQNQMGGGILNSKMGERKGVPGKGWPTGVSPHSSPPPLSFSLLLLFSIKEKLNKDPVLGRRDLVSASVFL